MSLAQTQLGDAETQRVSAAVTDWLAAPTDFRNSNAGQGRQIDRDRETDVVREDSVGPWFILAMQAQAQAQPVVVKAAARQR